MSPEEFERKSAINKIVNYQYISNDKMLVTYVPKLDYDIIKQHNLDFIKVSSQVYDKEVENRDNTSIVISAAVTAYARIHISKIKLYILSKGGEIYYSDTDSIVTNLELPDSMVNEKELGKLKLENMINKGIFITNKTYGFINNKGEFINKAKGINNKSLTYTDYESLLNNVNVKASKTTSTINWAQGEVKITDKDDINISSSSYTKRVKILKNGLWVNTRPQVITSSCEARIQQVKTGQQQRSYFRSSKDRDIITRTINDKENIFLKRAIGNFLKGLLQQKFPIEADVKFDDFRTLQNFMLNFDKEIKITSQSIWNIKSRNLPFKPLVITPDVEKFIKYIQYKFTEFKGEWLLDNQPYYYKGTSDAFTKPKHPKIENKTSNFDLYKEIAIGLLIGVLCVFCLILATVTDEDSTIIHDIITTNNEMSTVRSEAINSKEYPPKVGGLARQFIPTVWVDSDDYIKTLELIEEEKKSVKQILGKRTINSRPDIFETDTDIGESLSNLFNPKKGIDDNRSENGSIQTSGNESEGSYTPLTPNTYESLVKEFKETSIKLKTFEENLDNRTLSEDESREYQNLLDQQAYLIDQRTKNYDSNVNVYNKQIEESEKLKAKLLSLKDSNEIDSDKINVRHDINKTLEKTDERIEKLLFDKEGLHKKFLSESFTDKPESVNIKGWDKNLSSHEKRHLNTIGLDTSQAVKERLALENRMKENETNFEDNEGYKKDDVIAAKVVAFEIAEENDKYKSNLEIEKLEHEEYRLAKEIDLLEEELIAEEAKENIRIAKEADTREYRKDDLEK